MRITIIVITIAVKVLFMASQIVAQPSHILASKLMTGHELASDFVGADATTVYTFRLIKGKKENEGVVDVWRQDDLQFVRTMPVTLPSENVSQCLFIGGMMAGADPVMFIFFYNKEDDTRSIAMIQLDPLTGATRKQTILLTVPGKKMTGPLDMLNEAKFVYDSYTGRAALTLQELNYKQVEAESLVKMVTLERDLKVNGTMEVKLPVKRWVVVNHVALTGNGQVVIQAVESDASLNNYAQFITIVDLLKGTTNNYENLDGKAQGGVIENSKDDMLQSLPDGSVAFLQPFTKKGVPGYGLSGILTTIFDPSGQKLSTKLIEVKDRDIVKTDTKNDPYLVDMHLSRHWVASDGTWIFIFRRKLGALSWGDVLVVAADPKGSFISTTYYPLLEDQSFYNGVVPDDKMCWLLVSEFPSNIGKKPGSFELSETNSKWKVEQVPCMVRFDGQKFGNLEAIPGIKEPPFKSKTLNYDKKSGRQLIQWLYPEQKAIFMEIGR